MSQYVITGLQDKRDELVKVRDEAQRKIDQIEGVLELFDPSAVARKAPPRSGLTRLILEIIRTAETPPTPREITEIVASHRGDPGNIPRFKSRVENVLYKHRLRGVLEQVDVGKQAMVWRAVSISTIENAKRTESP